MFISDSRMSFGLMSRGGGVVGRYVGQSFVLQYMTDPKWSFTQEHGDSGADPC